MSRKPLACVAVSLAVALGGGAARAADVAVCVDVVERFDDWGEAGGKAAEPEAEAESEGAPDAGVELEGPPPGPVVAAPQGAVLAPIPRRESTPSPSSGAPQAPEDFEKPRERGPIPLWTSDTKLPIGQTSIVYLKRLFEHFVTHQPGYVAVSEGCAQRITVELYPLRQGWTAFARYSGTGREERVDQLFPSELSQYAERATLALLEDVPISATINRENVLRADSQKSVQRVKGANHFVLILGTQLRGGEFETARDDGSGETEDKVRLFSPLKTGLGYRGRFESWGLEAMAHVGIGTQKTSLSENAAGGHIDLGGDAGLAVHFLHYFDPRGLTSFYLGAGSTFELLWFRAIKDAQHRDEDSRTTLVSGGLDVDGVFGWEFMRASSVQFYLQGELNVPAYVVQNEDNYGSIDTWFPGFSLKLGVVF